VGRWQLAQLSYQAALQLQDDPAVQVSRQKQQLSDSHEHSLWEG
jgi:hypothetical protein